jgi:hypothetical protein
MPRHLGRAPEARQRERCTGQRSCPRVFAGMSVKRTRSSAVARSATRPGRISLSKIP